MFPDMIMFPDIIQDMSDHVSRHRPSEEGKFRQILSCLTAFGQKFQATNNSRSAGVNIAAIILMHFRRQDIRNPWPRF